jgi:hypothetical protein
MAHGQWTEIEARSVLEEWKRSGVGVEKFARSRGLVPQRLWWWKKKLGFGKASSPPPALVPVRITEAGAEAREPVTLLLRSGHRITAEAVVTQRRSLSREAPDRIRWQAFLQSIDRMIGALGDSLTGTRSR